VKEKERRKCTLNEKSIFAEGKTTKGDEAGKKGERGAGFIGVCVVCVCTVGVMVSEGDGGGWS
jgi:hypothetical protein